MLQIENVFVNVSKGEVAKSNDIKKAFGTEDVHDVVKEVCLISICLRLILLTGIPHRS